MSEMKMNYVMKVEENCHLCFLMCYRSDGRRAPCTINIINYIIFPLHCNCKRCHVTSIVTSVTCFTYRVINYCKSLYNAMYNKSLSLLLDDSNLTFLVAL